MKQPDWDNMSYKEITEVASELAEVIKARKANLEEYRCPSAAGSACVGDMTPTNGRCNRCGGISPPTIDPDLEAKLRELARRDGWGDLDSRGHGPPTIKTIREMAILVAGYERQEILKEIDQPSWYNGSMWGGIGTEAVNRFKALLRRRNQ